MLLLLSLLFNCWPFQLQNRYWCIDTENYVRVHKQNTRQNQQ